MQRWGAYVSVEWEQTCRGVYALHVRHLGVEDLAMTGRARVEDLLVRLHCSKSTLALISFHVSTTPPPPSLVSTNTLNKRALPLMCAIATALRM